jgi:hypothetical protein
LASQTVVNFNLHGIQTADCKLNRKENFMKKLSLSILVVLFSIFANAGSPKLHIQVLDEAGQIVSEMPTGFSKPSGGEMQLCCAQPEQSSFRSNLVRSIERQASLSTQLAVVDDQVKEVCDTEKFESSLMNDSTVSGLLSADNTIQVRNADLSVTALKCLLK